MSIGGSIVLEDVGSGLSVPADLLDRITQANLNDWRCEWLPAMQSLVRGMRAAGADPSNLPQTEHWDWEQKTRRVQGLLAFQSFAVMAQGKTQGLMRVELNHTGRMAVQVGKPLVYVEYLEVAPWNRGACADQRFRGVGTALMTAAVDLSLAEGFGGRTALHSLPQAESYYRDVCGMTDLGPDKNYDDLRYFEMTVQQAAKFIS
ncbi:hypothetical protein Terro_3104 [Terriglobus roseus DSM 18391]|uniref:N-acetyltransferase domain-containing protein n=1 Tax=Terriglobus roseus (strain DSM 18391 / NRRL B-41598 / KBS 63) TaxID=926566 RepID=I3ZJB6_TERRK|nr:hypothetical protein [Terriglobus roseus]AFL89334.1 hypothetical protein Terro_3104 [Terriglobus roseus DSM 18391]